MIEKERCIPCSIEDENTPLTLILMDPRRYGDEGDIPDIRIYRLVCLSCGCEITKYVTDNTISAIKELRGQMDTHYGKSIIFPIVI